jgi:hypothetical protein
MTIRLPVIAPDFTMMHGRHPIWERAWRDPCHYLFDNRGYPYLKLRYGGGDYGDDWVETRVRFDRRQYKAELYRKRILSVDLEKDDAGVWRWVVQTR